MKLRTSLLIALCFTAPSAFAVDWKWLGESTPVVNDPVAAFNSQGDPKNLVNILARLDAQLLEDFYAMVPEGQQVSNVLLDAEFTNINIRSDLSEGEKATLKMTFLNEGAGYRNSLGYFIYQTNNPPTTVAEIEHVLVFPNSSKSGSGGALVSGDQVDLNIELIAGQSIGFFINSNGWNGSYGYQKSSLLFGQPLYTLPSLNPSVGLGQRYHVVFNDTRSTGENDSGFFAYGFEDILTSGGDKDFNDLIFNVEVTPISAVEGYDEATVLPSVSGQVVTKVGVLAFEDNWPQTDDYDFNDAVLGYEITKVLDGDDNNESVKTLTLDYDIQAVGASFHNGIALRIPGLTQAMIDSVTLEKTLAGITKTITVDSIVTTKMSTGENVSYSYPLIKDPEYGDTYVSFTLSEDLFEELSTFDPSSKVYETFGCMYQTVPGSGGCPASTEASNLVLTINLKSTVLGSDVLGDMPFDHYMFGTHKNDIYRYNRNSGNGDWFSSWSAFFSSRDSANGPGPGKYLEIHLKEFSSGTNVFESDFSISDYAGAVTVDAQSHNQGNPFISTEITRRGTLTGNLPWVLDLPADWKHPKEKVDISAAYPYFYHWAEDNSTNSDWYESDVKENRLFN